MVKQGMQILINLRICLKSKLTGDASKAVAGYKLSNENYSVVADVLKK